MNHKNPLPYGDQPLGYTVHPYWTPVTHGATSQLAPQNCREIGEVLDRTKQGIDLQWRSAVEHFCDGWLTLYGEPLPRKTAIEHLAVAACYEPARPDHARRGRQVSAELLVVFAETWREETGEDISLDRAAELLALA
jgi:hypothetical protein